MRILTARDKLLESVVGWRGVDRPFLRFINGVAFPILINRCGNIGLHAVEISRIEPRELFLLYDGHDFFLGNERKDPDPRGLLR